jgi:hypothetical protein
MKTNKIIRAILIGTLFATAGLSSCKKVYVEPQESTTEKTPLEMASGAWKISSFQWHDRSDNSHFVSYAFQFKADGTLLVLHNGIKENGNWSKGNTTLKIFFPSEPLNELNNTWMIIAHSETTVALKGYGPNDNSSEFLIFSKINSFNIEK